MDFGLGVPKPSGWLEHHIENRGVKWMVRILKTVNFSDSDLTIPAAARVFCESSDEPKRKISKDIDIEESPKRGKLHYSTMKLSLILQSKAKGGKGETRS